MKVYIVTSDDAPSPAFETLGVFSTAERAKSFMSGYKWPSVVSEYEMDDDYVNDRISQELQEADERESVYGTV